MINKADVVEQFAQELSETYEVDISLKIAEALIDKHMQFMEDKIVFGSPTQEQTPSGLTQ